MKTNRFVLGLFGALVLSGGSSVSEKDIAFLNTMFQKRFQKLVEVNFGTGRMLPAEKGRIHPKPLTWPQEFQPETTEEKTVTERFFAKGMVWRVGILHLRPVPKRPVGSPRLTAGTVELLIENRLSLLPPRPEAGEEAMKKYLVNLDQSRKDEVAMMRSGALARMEAASRGEALDWNESGWTFALRPVRAEKDQCLSCHTDAKRGDVLGVLAYMIRQQSSPSR